ncbi:MAG: PaaI family thioesterase [Spirochaetaceae bacterium]|jgi:acyl-CoA thioesterase|nr:PaaI family thioesterase [Spirochaetaceae bacterium]
MEIDLDKIRRYFSADRFAALAGIVIDSAGEDQVECSMEITDKHRNAGGAVQGGAIFTLADLAFAVHSNLDLACGSADRGITVGQSCSISFLKGTRGKRLIAQSTCLSQGKNISVYRITIKDDLGVLIAEMHGNGFTTVKR